MIKSHTDVQTISANVLTRTLNEQADHYIENIPANGNLNSIRFVRTGAGSGFGKNTTLTVYRRRSKYG